MLLEIDIEHDDPAYVEQRGGYGFLSHLRTGGQRATHRRQAIARAVALFHEAEQAGRPEPEIGGLGLLVLQRALLTAEDFGGLLHGLLGPDPWQRLRTARIRDIDVAYADALSDFPAALSRVFALESEAQIDQDADSDDERVALKFLRAREAGRWQRMLERVADFWFVNRNAAKATMHGYPVVAGAYVHGPPPAGSLSAGVPRLPHRFAMAVTSTVKEIARPGGEVVLDADGDPIPLREVRTDRTLIRVDAGQVRHFARSGDLASKLVADVCELQASTILARRTAAVPLRGIDRLDKRGRRALAHLVP